MSITKGKDTFITCRNSQGTEFRATLLRLMRYTVAFEVYNPYSILQLSEVLTDFTLFLNDRMVYQGRAVVNSLVNTGILLVCEASLEADGWQDVDVFEPLYEGDRLETEFLEFLSEWRKVYVVLPEFKVAVADIQTLLTDLRVWLEQVEFSIRSEPTKGRSEIEQKVIEKLKQPFLPTTMELFGNFEKLTREIPEELQAIHRAYGRRQLHPLLLCAPFIYRTFRKPLGYAGDYEMVNMILREPFEGGSLFAKMVNFYILSQAPAEAHRNRIQFLKDKITEETKRVVGQGRKARIFDLGCGPAKEVQRFLAEEDLCEQADFTLMDFNDETLGFTRAVFEDLRKKYHRQTPVQVVKKSVNQILRESLRENEEKPSVAKYDMVYCAGLFDYLSDKVCKRLMNTFYDELAPGGLLVATNVDPSNPIRGLMEYILEWHLVYRDSKHLATLVPDKALPGNCVVKSDSTGVNVYLEVRKPE